MSLNRQDIENLVRVARAYLALVDATTITHGDGGFDTSRLTQAQLQTLIGRYYNEQEPFSSLPPNHRPSPRTLT